MKKLMTVLICVVCLNLVLLGGSYYYLSNYNPFIVNAETYEEANNEIAQSDISSDMQSEYFNFVANYVADTSYVITYNDEIYYSQ